MLDPRLHSRNDVIVDKDEDIKHQFQVSHFGPGDEILSPLKTVKFRQSNRFPNVPVPNLQIEQIEDEKKIIQFSFGKVVLKKLTVINDEAVKLLERSAVLLRVLIVKLDPEILLD